MFPPRKSRPYLLGVTFLLLGLGSYFAYRKPRHGCEPGSTCDKPATNKMARIGLWMTAGVVLVVAAFPYYSEPIANLLLASKASESTSAAPHLDRPASQSKAWTAQPAQLPSRRG
jgi:hypothetical protein